MTSQQPRTATRQAESFVPARPHPLVSRLVRVKQVKSFLDFLEKEGFEVQEIANKPRILTASQKTVEQRLQKLRKLGLSNINPNVLCRSRKDFKKYCDSLELYK